MYLNSDLRYVESSNDGGVVLVFNAIKAWNGKCNLNMHYFQTEKCRKS